MKKKLTMILIVLLVIALLAGAGYIISENFYNRTIIDLTYADYTDSDQIQVKMNGKVYLVHSTDVVLIKD